MPDETYYVLREITVSEALQLASRDVKFYALDVPNFNDTSNPTIRVFIPVEDSDD